MNFVKTLAEWTGSLTKCSECDLGIARCNLAFFLFLSVSVRFCPIFFCICQFLSVSVRFRLFLFVFVRFCPFFLLLYLSISVRFCLFLFDSVRFWPFGDFFWYLCYSPQTLRDSVTPVCRIFSKEEILPWFLKV